jgi:hypothetical protein
VRHARGKLICFLDADDMLAPGAVLRKLVSAYVQDNVSFLYTNQIQVRSSDHKTALYTPPEYDQSDWHTYNGITILIAKEDIIKIGGFDESLSGWEDWDFFSKLKINGLCGKHLPIPGFIYRYELGQRSVKSYDDKPNLLPLLKKRYSDYFEGRKKMGSCCPGDGDAIMEAKAALDRANGLNAGGVFRMESQAKFEQRSGLGNKPVRMEFIGERAGAATYFGHEGRQYRGGNNPMDKYANVHSADVQKMEMSSHWRVVKVERQPVEIPVAEPVTELPTQEIAVSETEPATMFDAMPDDIAIAVIPKAKKRTRKIGPKRNG